MKALGKLDNPVNMFIAGKFLLCYQAGKRGKSLVPVLVPTELAPEISLLIKIRGNDNHCQVSITCCRGWAEVAEVYTAAGLQKPETIPATKIRHRAATFYAYLDLSGAERGAFLKHMGHSQFISENIYQAPPSVLELTAVGHFLEALDQGTGPTAPVYQTSRSRKVINYMFILILAYDFKQDSDC
jgi:hypothetical protein